MTWIVIERDHADTPLLVGPYPPDVADVALEHSLLIEGLCQTDCTDAYTTTDEVAGVINGHPAEMLIVDLNDPDHTGEEYNNPDFRETLLTPMQVEAMTGRTLNRAQWEALAIAIPRSAIVDLIRILVDQIDTTDSQEG